MSETNPPALFLAIAKLTDFKAHASTSLAIWPCSSQRQYSWKSASICTWCLHWGSNSATVSPSRGRVLYGYLAFRAYLHGAFEPKHDVWIDSSKSDSQGQRATQLIITVSFDSILSKPSRCSFCNPKPEVCKVVCENYILPPLSYESYFHITDECSSDTGRSGKQNPTWRRGNLHGRRINAGVTALRKRIRRVHTYFVTYKVHVYFRPRHVPHGAKPSAYVMCVTFYHRFTNP